MNTINIAAADRPRCAVRGLVAPRGMCSAIIVGAEFCGSDKACAHRVAAPQLAQRFDAADVATAAQAVVDRWDTPLWKDVPATAEYIGRLRAALAAGQDTAAPAQPVAEPTHAQIAAYLEATGAYVTNDASREAAIADAVEADRASRGQAPAGATLPDGWVPLTITHEGQHPEEVAYGPQIMMDRLGKWLGKYFAQAAQADSVQEDAARWHWMAEYIVGTRTDLDDEIVACETVNDLRKLVEAAIKQGATQ